MDTRHLRYFRFAYETRSYTQAALLMSITPQGLARAVHGLERKMGVVLFSAGKGGDERIPTRYADALYRYCLVLDSAEQSLRQEYRRINLAERGVIRLAMVIGSLTALGSDFISKYEETHPGIRIITEEVGDYFCDNVLINGDCDLAITRGPNYHEAFDTTEVFRCNINYWVHSDSALAQQSAITIEDLAGRRICILDRSLKIHEVIMEACRKRNAKPRSITETAEIFFIFNWLLEGGEIGLTTDFTATLPVFARQKEIVTVPSDGIVTSLGISRLKEKSLPTHVQDFYRFCLEELG